MSDYETKLERALQRLEQEGVHRFNAWPLMYRALRAIGLQPRPPHYASPLSYVLSQGAIFGVFWGAGMWLFFWRRTGMAPVDAAKYALVAGLLFGALMQFARHYRNSKLNIGQWEDL